MIGPNEAQGMHYELEAIGPGRYFCDVASRWLVVSIELFKQWPGIARIEVLRYQQRVNGQPRYHTLIWRETGAATAQRGALEDAVTRVNRFMSERGLPAITLDDNNGASLS